MPHTRVGDVGVGVRAVQGDVVDDEVGHRRPLGRRGGHRVDTAQQQGVVRHDEVNAERKAKYAEIAKERGASVQAVAQIAGQKLIERTAKGGYVMGADGQWRQK